MVLLEPDEGRFAQIGREMATTGDFLVPRLNGIEQFYKPPSSLLGECGWISNLLGVSEWTARLPSALAFVGVVCLADRMDGVEVGGAKSGVDGRVDSCVDDGALCAGATDHLGYESDFLDYGGAGLPS